MSDTFKRKPWLWIVILLGLFVLLDVIFLVVARRTQGPDLEPVAPAVVTGGAQG